MKINNPKVVIYNQSCKGKVYKKLYSHLYYLTLVSKEGNSYLLTRVNSSGIESIAYVSERKLIQDIRKYSLQGRTI